MMQRTMQRGLGVHPEPPPPRVLDPETVYRANGGRIRGYAGGGDVTTRYGRGPEINFFPPPVTPLPAQPNQPTASSVLYGYQPSTQTTYAIVPDGGGTNTGDGYGGNGGGLGDLSAGKALSGIGGIAGGIPGGLAGNAIGTSMDRSSANDALASLGLQGLNGGFLGNMVANSSLGGLGLGTTTANQAMQSAINQGQMVTMVNGVPTMTALAKGLGGFNTGPDAAHGSPDQPSNPFGLYGLNGQPMGQYGAFGSKGESVFGDLGDPGTNQGMGGNGGAIGNGFSAPSETFSESAPNSNDVSFGGSLDAPGGNDNGNDAGGGSTGAGGQTGDDGGEGGGGAGWKRGGDVGKAGIGHMSPAARAGYIQGAGDGQSDSIDAKLAAGEYVLDSDVVNSIGNGDTTAGAKKLDAMRQKIRAHKRSAPSSKIPPKFKGIGHYLKAAA